MEEDYLTIAHLDSLLDQLGDRVKVLRVKALDLQKESRRDDLGLLVHTMIVQELNAFHSLLAAVHIGTCKDHGLNEKTRLKASLSSMLESQTKSISTASA